MCVLSFPHTKVFLVKDHSVFFETYMHFYTRILLDFYKKCEIFYMNLIIFSFLDYLFIGFYIFIDICSQFFWAEIKKQIIPFFHSLQGSQAASSCEHNEFCGRSSHIIHTFVLGMEVELGLG